MPRGGTSVGRGSTVCFSHSCLFKLQLNLSLKAFPEHLARAQESENLSYRNRKQPETRTPIKEGGGMADIRIFMVLLIQTHHS